MERGRASSSLHQRIARTVDRAARAQLESQVLIAECDVATASLRDTIATAHRDRDLRAAATRARPDR